MQPMRWRIQRILDGMDERQLHIVYRFLLNMITGQKEGAKHEHF